MKTVVITGGSSGIGKELVDLFTYAGYTVYSLARTNPHNFDGFIKCDVTDVDDVAMAIDEIAQRGKIDILINNAGVGINGTVELTSDEKFRQGLDVNFTGTYLVTKYALPHLSSKARIINISSACAMFALPFKSVYCAAKAGVNMLTYSLHMELSDTNIQVCAICPGDTKSGFSANRVKELATNERYGNRLKSTSEKLDAREDKRMTSTYVAIQIFKTALKKRLPVLKIIGGKYKLFYVAAKVLPTRAFLYLTNKMLGY